MRDGQQHSQEVLLVAGERSGQLQPINPEQEPGAVNVVEHYLYLQNAVRHLGLIGRSEGFIKASETPKRDQFETRYGTNLDRVVVGAGNSADAELVTTKHAFARAYGMYVLDHYEGIDAEAAKVLTAQSFEEFKAKYGGHENRIIREKYMAVLAERVTILQQKTISERNRLATSRPHKRQPRPKQATTKEATPPLDMQLNTQERLVAIQNDPRARFLPTTNREKNVVLSYLDYLDNPEYPLSVTNQLLEVYNRQQRLRVRGLKGGRPNPEANGPRSVESLVYEVGDYLENSIQQLAALSDLQERVEDCPNHRITLPEEIEPSDRAGFAALVRYRDIKAFSENKYTGVLLDPLGTKELRWAKFGPGKHKSVEDQYTGNLCKPETAGYIEAEAAKITIGEARKLLQGAILNEENRRAFMVLIIRQTHFMSVISRLKPAYIAGQDLLERLAIAS